MAVGLIPQIQIPPLAGAVIWWAPTFTDQSGTVQAYTNVHGYGSGLGANGGSNVATFTLYKSDKTTIVQIAGSNTTAGVWNTTLARWELRFPAALALPSPFGYGTPEPYYLKATLNDTTDSINVQPYAGGNWLVAVTG